MTSIPDPYRDIEAACNLLRQQAAEREARLTALEAEMQQMRDAMFQIEAERNFYRKRYNEQVVKYYQKHADEVEAEWAAVKEEAERNPGDILALIRELESSTAEPNRG
jgi:chromosome segregation ATPase